MSAVQDFPSYSHFHTLMSRYQLKDLVNVDRESFEQRINEFLELDDYRMEGIVDSSRQNKLAVKFHWGHHHDFGEYSMPGNMGKHHIALLTTFVDNFQVIPRSLEGLKVLDVGCFTGGTSMLYSPKS